MLKLEPWSATIASRASQLTERTDTGACPYLAKLNHWRYTAQLWLLKRPLIDKDWLLYAPEYVLHSDIFDRAMTQKWPRYTG